MTNRSKLTAAVALALGLAATPSFAQGLYADSSSYNRDGTLNVWGAHIDPVRERGGLIGGITGAAGTIVGGTLGAAGTIVGGTANAAGTVVGGTVDAAGDVVTGSIRRPADYTARQASGRYDGRTAY